MKIAVHWFRRDLRISDNTALSEAAKRAELVVPVFILEDAFRTGPDVGAARLTFLLRSLESLRQNLAEFGYPLIIRRGRSEVELPKLCAELRAEAVFCNKRYEPYAQARDNRVFNALNAAGVGFETFKDAVIWEERELLTKAGNPYTVFTPYSRAWKERSIPSPRPKLRAIKKRFPRIASDTLPLDSAELGHSLSQTIQAAGERAAKDKLREFLKAPVFVYGSKRDFPAENGTSHLSAHLRCGTIGIRTILANPGSDEWTIDASHETLEMLVDPYGNRLQTSAAIGIGPGGTIVDEAGQFGYLVEACDPCEADSYAYSVQGVAVSDFLTPHFYDPVVTPGTRYSFTGAIKAPRQILPGGYISWVDLETHEMQQLLWVNPNQPPIIRNLGPAPAGMSLRVWVDSQMIIYKHKISYKRIPNVALLDACKKHRVRMWHIAAARASLYQ